MVVRVLQAMSQAGTGVYCGPLRLLAMEVYDSLNAQGTLCNLLTGKQQSFYLLHFVSARQHFYSCSAAGCASCSSSQSCCWVCLVSLTAVRTAGSAEVLLASPSPFQISRAAV